VTIASLAAVAAPYVPLSSLWLPILIAAALVWIASALFWTVSPHHKKEFGKLPDEDRVLAAMRAAGVMPGHYFFPHAGSPERMKDPEFQKKLDAGPVCVLTVTTADAVRNMAKPMVLSFVFYIVVSFFVAYVASRTVAAGADYLTVFRVVGAVAFLAYGFGIFPDTIWFARGWSRAWKHVFDALVFALLTAGVFGWRWPGVM
jgi:hypothetical protein